MPGFENAAIKEIARAIRLMALRDEIRKKTREIIATEKQFENAS